jgi:hypothetical protein
MFSVEFLEQNTSRGLPLGELLGDAKVYHLPRQESNLILAPISLGFSSQLLKNFGNIVGSPDFVFFTPYLFEVELSEFSQINWNIRTCNPDASRLDGQGLLPHSPDMLAAVEKFLWKVVTLVGVMYTKNRDSIALHVTLGRS